MADLSAPQLAILAVAVAAGGVIQGSIGFGFALVAVPAMALVLPEALPATSLLIALPMTVVMALRERRSIDVQGFAWITGGRVLGTLAGVWLLAAVPTGSLSALLGGVIVAAAVISALGPEFEARRRTRFAAGVASGVMGTAGAVGGPALALVYQRQPGPVLRSTLAISFVVGVAMSLAALGVAGRVETWHGTLALELLPALVIGLAVSRITARYLDARWLRPVVLTFAASSGVYTLLRGLIG